MHNAWSGKTRVRLDADGLPYDDVPHDIASREQLQSYDRAAAQMREFKVPALWDRKDPHSYMLFGLLDGTGNDVEKDPLHATNVAKLRDSIVELKESGIRNIDFEYLPGPGTQTNLVENTVDGALGRTSLARAEDLYVRLAKRIGEILEADPQARISTHLEGFSRGASTVPLLDEGKSGRGPSRPADDSAPIMVISCSWYRWSSSSNARCEMVCSSISSTEGMTKRVSQRVHRALRPAAFCGTRSGLPQLGQSMVI
ncbi:MAG: DUF2235 domain-containing protein [Nitrospiraceae bacterium]|nr:DUF2235 domain-containing protein [Nitrospiraceae bacterium]